MFENFSGGMGGGLGADLGGIASGLYNLFGTSNPYQSAQGYYNKIPGMLNQMYSPWMQSGGQATASNEQYMNRGNSAGNTLMGQYSQMTSDPSGILNRLGAGFHQSPGFAFQTNQALQAANRAAAAGGMAGSPEEQQQIAGVTNQLANQDYYNYLNHSQQIYGQGIQGLQHTEGLGENIGQDMYNQGANMTDNLAQNLGSAYMNQGNLAMARDQYNNQTTGQGYGQIFGGLAGLAGSLGSWM